MSSYFSSIFQAFDNIDVNVSSEAIFNDNSWWNSKNYSYVNSYPTFILSIKVFIPSVKFSILYIYP